MTVKIGINGFGRIGVWHSSEFTNYTPMKSKLPQLTI